MMRTAFTEKRDREPGMVKLVFISFLEQLAEGTRLLMRAGASLAAGGVALMLFRWLEYVTAQLKSATKEPMLWTSFSLIFQGI